MMVLDFAYDELLIPNENIVNLIAGDVCYGYAISICYPSYRGTFLSCIEQLEVQVDGEKVPQKNIQLAINGKKFLLSQLSELHKEYWFVLDIAYVIIMQNNGLLEGEHEISVRMVHRIPYTGYFGQYLVLESVCNKTLICVK